MIRCFLLLVIAGFLITPASPTTAQTGGPPKFKIEYNFDFPGSNAGVAPIRVRISRQPAVPMGRDQRFNVLVGENWRSNQRSSKTVSSQLTIPAGQTTAEVVLYAQLGNDHNAMLLIENGRGDDNYSPTDLLHTRISNVNARAAVGRLNPIENSWLIVSGKVKNTRPLFQTTATNANKGIINFRKTNVSSIVPNWAEDVAQAPGLKTIFGERPTVLIQSRAQWQAMPPSNLPETWVGLSPINYLLIEAAEFESLCESNGYRELFENWVGAGGNLVVFNTKKSLDHAGKIFPALLGPNKVDQPVQWRVPSASTKKSRKRTLVPTASTLQSKTTIKPTDELSAADRVASRAYLRGQVFAIVSPESLGRQVYIDSFPTKRQIGKTTYRVQEFNHLSAVPGVGKPPIILFAIATGLFLFLIGPVILVVVSLNNDRRYYFYAVPVTSFITCSCILGYAVIADFNKQWARTETVMTLDQRSGRAFAEATSAYYCGNQPSYYAFDYKTLFATSADTANGFKIRQLENEARLSGAKIQPRRTHEVYAAKPMATDQRFTVLPPKGDDANSPQVTNRLGGKIQIAGFEYQGQYFVVRNLSHEETATAQPIPRVQCQAEIGKTIRAQRPSGGSPFFTDRANQTFAIQMQRPGEFAAVLETNPAVQQIVQPFELKLQSHIVHGRY